MAQTITIREGWQDRGTDIDDNAIVTRRRSYFAVVRDDTNNPHRVSDFRIIEAFSAQTGIVRWSAWVGADGESDSTCRCTKLSVHQSDDLGKWEIRVDYTTARASGWSSAGGMSPRQLREKAAAAHHDGGPPPSDPSQRRMVLRFGHQEYEEALERDAITNAAVCNSARDKFVPPVMRPMSFRVITLERNELAFDSTFTHQFMNTVNAGTFYGYGAKKVLCKAIDAETDFEANIPFFRVTYVFWVRPISDLEDTWVWKQLDAGLNELDANNKPIAIRDQQTSQPVTSPRLLNGAGGALGHGIDPVYLDFNRYPQKNFALLGLGG